MMTSDLFGELRNRRWVRSLTMLVCLLSCLPGCSRQFWRRQADMDSYDVIEERQCDDRWYLPRINIEPDPRSRFYDPYALDKGPLPPDDPAAHEYMHHVSTWIPGYKSWHEFGQAFSVENPQWYDSFEMVPVKHVYREYAASGADESGTIHLASYTDDATAEDGTGEPAEDGENADASTGAGDDDAEEGEIDGINPENVYVRPEIQNMTLQQAIELSQIHSRDYQTQIENVFLDALDLTLDRFQFDVRYLPLPGIGLDHSMDGNGQNSGLGMNAVGGIRQALPAGGEWAVQLANNTLWLFSGDNQTSTSSLLSYSIVQPLMQGAGRKVVLASLTQQERNLLYGVRLLARFRQTFFNGVVSSYLGLLQTRQGIINTQNNITQTETQLERSRVLESMLPPDVSEPLDVLPEGVVIPPELAPKVSYNDVSGLLRISRTITDAEIGQLRLLSDDAAFQKAINDIIDNLNAVTNTLTIVQLETQLANSRNGLLSAEVGYQNALDSYKLQLGLPPDMVLTLDESFLAPFQLIDNRLFALERDVNDFVMVSGALDETDPSLANLRDVSQRLRDLITQVKEEGMDLVLRDKQRFLQVQDHILADKDPEDKARLLFDLDRDQRILTSTQQDLEEIERVWQLLDEHLADDMLPQNQRQVEARVIADLREDLLKVTQNLQVILVGIRVEMIELNPFDMDLEEAIEYAIENRLDLMNARAAVMDARRAVEVAANQLEAVLDVVVEGDIGTPAGTRPFDFRAMRSTFRTGLQFTTPVNQISQRNAYRASLIAYQRARRAYMLAEDSVKIQVRADWRQLKVQKKNFELRRRAIRSSAIQYDITAGEVLAQAQGGGQGGGQQNLGLNLLNALNNLLESQNAFIGIWVNYERNRLNFYQDIGMMEIDSQGVWDDAYYQNWLRTGTPVISTTSTPSTPQGARRVLPNDLHGRENENADDRQPPVERSGIVLASRQTEQRKTEIAPQGLEENRQPVGDRSGLGGAGGAVRPSARMDVP